MFLHFSNDNSQDIATKQLCILPDMSVKAAHNSLIKSLKKSPTSHILFLNNRVFKFGHAQSAICSLRKRDNETTRQRIIYLGSALSPEGFGTPLKVG